MRGAILLAFASLGFGCASAPPTAPTASVPVAAPKPLPEAFDLALAALVPAGCSHPGNSGATLKVSCTCFGILKAHPRLPRGVWRLVVDHHDEPDRDGNPQRVHSVVKFGEHAAPLDSLGRIMDRCPIRQQTDGELEIMVYASGGWGTQMLTRIAFEPAQLNPDWNTDRCRWLDKGMASALAGSGGRVSDEMREYVDQLP